MPTAALSLKNISHSFGKKEVLRNISWQLQPGKTYALIGPNGAGKSTLFRILTGLIRPTEGSVQYGTIDVATQPVEARKQFVYLSDEPSIYPYLSGEEYLHLMASTRGIDRGEATKRLQKIERLFPHLPSLHEPLGEQSRGTRQKILFLGALLSQPRVLLSDEPIVGLDPTSIHQFGKQLRSYAQSGGTTLLALHTLEFAQEYVDEVAVLVNGEIRTTAEVTGSTLEKLYQKYTA